MKFNLPTKGTIIYFILYTSYQLYKGKKAKLEEIIKIARAGIRYSTFITFILYLLFPSVIPFEDVNMISIGTSLLSITDTIIKKLRSKADKQTTQSLEASKPSV